MENELMKLDEMRQHEWIATKCEKTTNSGWDCDDTAFGVSFCTKCGAFYDTLCVKKWKYCPICGDRKGDKNAIS